MRLEYRKGKVDSEGGGKGCGLVASSSVSRREIEKTGNFLKWSKKDDDDDDDAQQGMCECK